MSHSLMSARLRGTVLVPLVVALATHLLPASSVEAGCRCDYVCNTMGNGQLCVDNGADCATSAALLCAGANGGVLTANCTVPCDPSDTGLACEGTCSDSSTFAVVSADGLECANDAVAECGGATVLNVTALNAAVIVEVGFDLFDTPSAGLTMLLGVPFEGVSLGTFDFGGAIGVQNVGLTDTIVQRLERAEVPSVPDTSAPVAIEIIALQLKSVDPFDPDGPNPFGTYYVTLQTGIPSVGTMTITFDNEDGGTFISEFEVRADLRLGTLDGPIVGEEVLLFTTIDPVTWGRIAPAGTLTIDGVNRNLNGTDTSTDFHAGVDGDGVQPGGGCFPHGAGGPEFPSTHCPAPPTTIGLDIKPGSCPNPLNTKSNGVTPVSITSTDTFDASEIDISSVQICRADGVGSCVSPNEGPPGPHSVFADTATQFDGEACDCHNLGGDGLIDLSSKFRTQNMVAAMQLDSEPGGSLIELVVKGTTQDGGDFVTDVDCILLVPSGGNMNAHSSNQFDVYLEVSEPDQWGDASGWTTLARKYDPGTPVTVVAPETLGGGDFLYWNVDGVPLPAGLMSIDIIVPARAGEDMNLVAVYSTFCLGDVNGDETVNATDLALILGGWGPNFGHPADFDGDGMVNAFDLATLLGKWGICE